METYFLKSDDIRRFYEAIAQDYQLYIPVKTEAPARVSCEYSYIFPSDDYFLKKFMDVSDQEPVFNDYRCIEPTRVFFSRFKEEVCGFLPEGDARQEPEKRTKPLAICGIKNCDLFSLKIQDYVFLGGDNVDTLYRQRRENALIISGDCPSFKEVCFCRAFDINPFAVEGFDLNISPINDGFLIDAGSKRAELITRSLRSFLAHASVGQLSGRQAKRETVVWRLDEHLKHHKIPGKEVLKEIVLAGYDSKVWQEQMRACVECGGCVFMCDTCHCFLLADEETPEGPRRLRVWDGCLYKNFARVAGGANPLKMRYMRLRNRYLKKFDFFVDNLGTQACCGCGRCVEVCPGKIDIRHILRRLHEDKYLQAR